MSLNENDRWAYAWAYKKERSLEPWILIKTEIQCGLDMLAISWEVN